MDRAFWDTIFLLSGYFFTYSQVQDNSTSTTMTLTPTTTTTITATNTTAVLSTTVKRKFLVAAVHSHFADCPDSHSHFCFHGTCRFLILEETPACVCHPGFIGMRCEHADLLAVVATNQRQQTLATMLMLCILGSVLIALLCTIINGLKLSQVLMVFFRSPFCHLKPQGLSPDVPADSSQHSGIKPDVKLRTCILFL